MEQFKEAILTVDELQKYQGNENLTEEKLEQQSNNLLELSMILYDIYLMERTRQGKKNTTDGSPEIDADAETE